MGKQPKRKRRRPKKKRRAAAKTKIVYDSGEGTDPILGAPHLGRYTTISAIKQAHPKCNLCHQRLFNGRCPKHGYRR